MSTEKIIYALREVLRAEQEGQDSRNQRRDWSYHGHRWIEKRRKVHEEFAAALDEVIDARVCAALKANTPYRFTDGKIEEVKP